VNLDPRAEAERALRELTLLRQAEEQRKIRRRFYVDLAIWAYVGVTLVAAGLLILSRYL